MKISIIIATLHRTSDLWILFDSLVNQTKYPFEIVIVDQSDDDKTKQLCLSFKEKLPLKYFHYSHKSSTHSRNFGIRQTKGDIIAFLDDDTKLFDDYLEQIINFYHDYPHAIGGMGKIVNFSGFKEKLLGKGILYSTYKAIAVFFGLQSFKKGFLVLSSGRNIDYYECNEVVQAQWLSTCNSWFKREIFTEFIFEEKFTRWSYGEDKMLTYLIQKKHANSLFFFPKAQLYHYESLASRLGDRDKISMKVLYQFWFFYSSMDKKSIHFWWGNLGEITLHFLNFCLGREPFSQTYYYIIANVKLLSHYREVKSGNFKAFSFS